jgi:hypothetical protein
MSTVQQTTVVGVFETRARAEVAVDRLWAQGFSHDHVGIAAPGEPAHEAITSIGEKESHAADGAVVGAWAGGTVGALAGALVTGLIPGVGPVFAGGILLGILTGAAAGAAGGTFIGPFIAMGFSEEEAQHYQQRVKAGHTLVLVHAGERAVEAERILRDEGAFDVHVPAFSSTPERF